MTRTGGLPANFPWARFVVPVSVVVNIFQEGSGSDNVKDRNAIAAGDYNKAIDAKIAEIKSTCNV